MRGTDSTHMLKSKIRRKKKEKEKENTCIERKRKFSEKNSNENLQTHFVIKMSPLRIWRTGQLQVTGR